MLSSLVLAQGGALLGPNAELLRSAALPFLLRSLNARPLRRALATRAGSAAAPESGEAPISARCAGMPGGGTPL